jgi:hypothetical protein
MKFCMLLLIFSLPAFSALSSFSVGIHEFNQGNFESALQHFQKVGGTSPELEYNLGNTLMRLGRTPEAIAHYRRAQWLKPGDADLQANLERAVAVYEAPLPELPLSRSLTGWWTPSTWQTVFLAGCWITAALGLLTTLHPRFRSVAFWTLPPAVVLLCLAGFATWASLPSHFLSEAVIKGPQGITRFEPLPDATQQNALPGGTVVTVLDSSRDWLQVDTGEVTGWIQEADVVKL